MQVTDLKRSKLKPQTIPTLLIFWIAFCLQLPELVLNFTASRVAGAWVNTHFR
jgi:hypothetical protein